MGKSVFVIKKTHFSQGIAEHTLTMVKVEIDPAAKEKMVGVYGKITKVCSPYIEKAYNKTGLHNVLPHDEWQKTMWCNHALFGVVGVHMHSDKDVQDFTFGERLIFLAFAISAAWPGVYLKDFYLSRLFYTVAVENLELLPDRGWLTNVLDALFCAGIGGGFDLILGREFFVRKVLKKDWDQKGGFKGAISMVACAYALLVSAACQVHFLYVICIQHSDLFFKLLFKYLFVVILKLTIIEAGMQTGLKMWEKKE